MDLVVFGFFKRFVGVSFGDRLGAIGDDFEAMGLIFVFHDPNRLNAFNFGKRLSNRFLTSRAFDTG